MNKEPFFSIITVCFNSEKTIRKTIEHVLNQTFTDFEYIIIDGKSTDHTVAIAQEYSANFDGRLSIVSEPDNGIYNAMNKGILKSRGTIIGIINSDDHYDLTTLEKVVKIYREHGEDNNVIIVGDIVRINDRYETCYRQHFTQNRIDRKENFGHPSMFTTREVYDRIGMYSEDYRFAADSEFQYRSYDRGVRWILSTDVFTYMMEGGATDNPKYRKVWYEECVRMKLDHHRGSPLKVRLEVRYSIFRVSIKRMLPGAITKHLYKVINK